MKYRLQPTATTEQAIMYSRMRFQPTNQAMSSPSVA